MPYDNAIPQAADIISASQAQLLDNFIALQQLFEVNHVNFNQGGQGKHKWLTMPVQAPDPATAAGEMAMFTRTSAYTAAPELCVKRENNGTVTEITSSLGASPGWGFTSSGLLLKWGLLTTGAGDFPGGTVFNFPVAATIPVFGTVLTAYISVTNAVAGADIAATLRAVTTTQITVLGTQRTANVGAAVNFYYLVVGLL